MCPKAPELGLPMGRGASSEPGHHSCPGCGAQREEADGQHPKNSSLSCSFMACNKQGSKLPPAAPVAPSSSPPSCRESASS